MMMTAPQHDYQDIIVQKERRAARLFYWLKAARKDPDVHPEEFAAVAHEYRTVMAQLAEEMVRRQPSQA